MESSSPGSSQCVCIDLTNDTKTAWLLSVGPDVDRQMDFGLVLMPAILPLDYFLSPFLPLFKVRH